MSLVLGVCPKGLKKNTSSNRLWALSKRSDTAHHQETLVVPLWISGAQRVSWREIDLTS